MVFAIVDPFSWIFNAVSSEMFSHYTRLRQDCSVSPPADFWLIDLNFRRASGKQGQHFVELHEISVVFLANNGKTQFKYMIHRKYIWAIDQVWGQDGWILLAKIFFCVFMDRDGVEVHELGKK